MVIHKGFMKDKNSCFVKLYTYIISIIPSDLIDKENYKIQKFSLQSNTVSKSQNVPCM